MDVYWENGQTAPAEATVVGFKDLPATDRQALRIAAVGPEDGGREDGEGGDGLPQETLSVGEFPAPYPDGGTDSQLIGTRTLPTNRSRHRSDKRMATRSNGSPQTKARSTSSSARSTSSN